MIKSSVTISRVSQIKNGSRIYWDPLEASNEKAEGIGFDGVELIAATVDAIDFNTFENLLKRNNNGLSAIDTGAGKAILGLKHPDPNVRKVAITFDSCMIRFGALYGTSAIIGSMQGIFAPYLNKEQSISWLVEGLNFLIRVA